MAAGREFFACFGNHLHEAPLPYFVITGAGHYLPVYLPQFVGDEPMGYYAVTAILPPYMVLWLQLPLHRRMRLFLTRVTPPNEPFAPGFLVMRGRFSPVYWPLVVSSGIGVYFVAYSLARFVPAPRIPFPLCAVSYPVQD